jgi:hypothetical protein
MQQSQQTPEQPTASTSPATVATLTTTDSTTTPKQTNSPELSHDQPTLLYSPPTSGVAGRDTSTSHLPLPITTPGATSLPKSLSLPDGHGGTHAISVEDMSPELLREVVSASE